MASPAAPTNEEDFGSDLDSRRPSSMSQAELEAEVRRLRAALREKEHAEGTKSLSQRKLDSERPSSIETSSPSTSTTTTTTTSDTQGSGQRKASDAAVQAPSIQTVSPSAQKALAQPRVSSPKVVPLTKVPIRVHTLDGSFKTVAIHPAATASQVVDIVCKKISQFTDPQAHILQQRVGATIVGILKDDDIPIAVMERWTETDRILFLGLRDQTPAEFFKVTRDWSALLVHSQPPQAGESALSRLHRKKKFATKPGTVPPPPPYTSSLRMRKSIGEEWRLVCGKLEGGEEAGLHYSGEGVPSAVVPFFAKVTYERTDHTQEAEFQLTYAGSTTFFCTNEKEAIQWLTAYFAWRTYAPGLVDPKGEEDDAENLSAIQSWSVSDGDTESQASAAALRLLSDLSRRQSVFAPPDAMYDEDDGEVYVVDEEDETPPPPDQ